MEGGGEMRQTKPKPKAQMGSSSTPNQAIELLTAGYRPFELGWASTLPRMPVAWSRQVTTLDSRQAVSSGTDPSNMRQRPFRRKNGIYCKCVRHSRGRNHGDCDDYWWVATRRQSLTCPVTRSSSALSAWRPRRRRRVEVPPSIEVTWGMISCLECLVACVL